MAHLVLHALKGPSTMLVLYLSLFLSSDTFIRRSTAQLVVARVARVFMVTPKVLLPVLPARQVKDLHQARLHRVGAMRGIQTAYHPATSSATEPAVRNYLSHSSPSLTQRF